MPASFRRLPAAAFWMIGALAASCALAQTPASPPAASAAVTLRDAFKDAFVIGAAIRPDQIGGGNPQAAALIVREFNSITAENVMKMEPIHPRPGNDAGSYDFAPADAFVDFGVKHRMRIIGHTLCWHSQMPAWMSQPELGQAELTKDVLLRRLREHIMTVVGRYKGKVHGWDVVNEALNDGAGDYRPTVFYKVIGKEYLVHAFKWAHEADPDAELYYNDYNLDANDRKRATALELINYLRAQGCRVDGIGLQGHYNLTTPATAKIDETIGLFAALGLKVHITELDVTAIRGASVSGAVGSNPGGAGPRPFTTEDQEAQARRYGEIFAVFMKHRPSIARVTFWGVRDSDSWRKNLHPLIFDEAYGRKPAYDAIIAAAKTPVP